MKGGEVVATEVKDEIEREEVVEIMDDIRGGGEVVVVQGVMTEEHVEEEDSTVISQNFVLLSRREFIIQ